MVQELLDNFDFDSPLDKAVIIVVRKLEKVQGALEKIAELEVGEQKGNQIYQYLMFVYVKPWHNNVGGLIESIEQEMINDLTPILSNRGYISAACNEKKENLKPLNNLLIAIKQLLEVVSEYQQDKSSSGDPKDFSETFKRLLAEVEELVQSLNV